METGRVPPSGHRKLSDEEDKKQRGDDPRTVVGRTTIPALDPDPDPDWQPDPGRVDQWRGVSNEIGKKRLPHREDVYPYLLIRAMASGDRGKRPTWPPTPCWESPDILLIDAAYRGAFDPSRLVVSPRSGRSYRVFVRVWNLGLFPAVGVHVKAWAIQSGFFGVGNQDDPYYQQHLIGGRWIELADRTRPECVVVAELDMPWKIDPAEAGHHCLLAQVSCPLDQADGLLLSNNDRHVGQRNLDVLAGAANLQVLLSTLGSLVPDGSLLEVVHAGPAIRGVLQAVGGLTLPEEGGKARRIVVPSLGEVRHGVSTGSAVHLLVAFRESGRNIVVRSDRLAHMVGIPDGSPSRGRAHPFDRATTIRQLLKRVGEDGWKQAGVVTDRPMADALTDALADLVGARELTARAVAAGLGGPIGAQHALRFALTDSKNQSVGGYTIVVS